MKRRKIFTTLCLTAFVVGGSFTGCANSEKAKKSWHDMPLGFVAPPARTTNDFVSARNKDQESAAKDEALANRPVLRTIRTMSEALKPKVRVVKANDPTQLEQPNDIEDPKLYVIAGRMAAARQQYDAAETHFQKALQVDNKNLSAIVGYGQALTAQGKFTEAIEMYRKGIEQGANDLALVSEVGYCLLMSGETKRSVQVLQALVDQEPTSEVYRKQLAFALVSDGQENAAFQHLVTIVDESVAWKQIGEIQSDLGDTAGASESLKLAASLSNDPRVIMSQSRPNPNALANAISQRSETIQSQSAPFVAEGKVHDKTNSFSMQNVANPVAGTANLPAPDFERRSFSEQGSGSNPDINAVVRARNSFSDPAIQKSQIRSSRTVRVGEFSEFAANSAELLDVERDYGVQENQIDFVSQMNAASFNDDISQTAGAAIAPARAETSRLSQEAFDLLEAEKAKVLQAKIDLINTRVAESEGKKHRPFIGSTKTPPRASVHFTGDVEKPEASESKGMSAALRTVLFR